jgi:hypothetical protein
MTRDEEYLYRRLLDYQASTGYVVPDPSRLAFACKMTPDEFRTAWASIRDCFEEYETGRFRNRRMHAERERVFAAVESARENGRKGGRPAGVPEKSAQEPGGSPQETGRLSGRKPGGKAIRDPRASSTGVPAEHHAAPPPAAGAPGPSEQATQPPTPKRTRKPPTGDHAALMAWWATAWEEARGIAWSFSGKDGAAAKRLLEIAKGDLAAIKARGDRMLCNTNRWHAERASLSHLASQWNELGVEILPAAVNGSGRNGYAPNGRRAHKSILDHLAEGTLILSND